MARGFRKKFLLFALLVGVPLAVIGAGPLDNVIESFEEYNVPDGLYLDPATVPGSRWSRNDLGTGPDWEVACCSGTGNIPNDDTFDGSAKHRRLRRANNVAPLYNSRLTTDFSLTAMTEGTVTFELNPSSIGGGSAFVGGLFDSVSGAYKARVRFREITNNSGDSRSLDPPRERPWRSPQTPTAIPGRSAGGSGCRSPSTREGRSTCVSMTSDQPRPVRRPETPRGETS